VLRVWQEGRPRGWQVMIVAGAMLAMLITSTVTAGKAAGSVRAPRAPTRVAGRLAGSPAGSSGLRPYAATAGCRDVYFLGARGSGDPAGGQFHGLGAAVSKMVAVLQGIMRKNKLTYATEAVNYPAASVNVLKPSAKVLGDLPNIFRALNDYLGQVHKYAESIHQGIISALSMAKRLHSRCKFSLLVLVGYSQGAMVMHEAELGLSSGVTNCLGGTLLLGDGDRVSRTKAKEFGTSVAKSEGIQVYTGQFLGFKTGIHDVAVPSTTANICNMTDMVCDFNAHTLINFNTAIKVHTSYAQRQRNGSYKYEPVLTSAASRLAKIVVNAILHGQGPPANCFPIPA
jgi:Cutinase